MTRLQDLPLAERPRERLLTVGAHRMTPTELLAVLLGTGRGRAEDALALAERVLEELDGPDGLAGASTERLLAVKGIGPVKASRIRAAFELALRAGPIEPAEAPPDPVAEVVGRLRGQIAPSERAVLACEWGSAAAPVPLGLGATLGPQLRPGVVLVQLLGHGKGPWYIAALRAGGGPTAAEREAAARLLAAARLVEVPLAKVLLIGRSRHWIFDEAGGEPEASAA